MRHARGQRHSTFFGGPLVLKSFSAFLLVAVTASLANADVIPPIGLAPGSEYQLILVTADTTNAISTNISTYNTFVSTEAALNSGLPAATWYAVGSTETVNANVNAPNVMADGSYLPVYNTAGILVSSNASGGLYAGSILSPVGYNQYGSSDNAQVWTGSAADGVAEKLTPTLGALGTANVEYGAANLGGGSWLQRNIQEPALPNPLYGLSSPITVPSPEPATITLFGSALSLLAGYRLLRRRAA
jgi:hypothetical protein